MFLVRLFTATSRGGVIFLLFYDCVPADSGTYAERHRLTLCTLKPSASRALLEALPNSSMSCSSV